MKVIHVSAECYPVAKAGGLADVVGALPKYQSKEGDTVEVVMPFYNNAYVKKSHFEEVCHNRLLLGDQPYDFEVLKLNGPGNPGFNLYVIKIPGLLDRENIYSYDDDVERFTAFQIAVMDWILNSDRKPDIVHCHDHHTGLIPFIMSYSYKYSSLKNIPTVLTIHNAQYQGWFGFNKIHYIPEFKLSNAGLLDWGGQINPLATAIKCAWKVTTVSPSYMEELKTSANGLEWLLDHESNKETGILNGIDPQVWDPAKDSMLVENYSVKNSVSGKKANKEWLCKEYNLDAEKPLFIFIGRLVWEKGADILPGIFYRALINDDLEVNILALGSGSPEIESKLKSLINPFRGSYHVHIGYNERLSHVMYAGADFLLMPSRVEPCGLNQMYALRYGTIPVVHETGGLKDTVTDIEKGGFGICHKEVSVDKVYHSIQRAAALYKEEKEFKKIQREIMKIDHSWDNSANQYNELYTSLIR
ncbi:glycogen synthase [Abyssalbus ytuae]|uniref:Glycogen synthase n=1 Tax=Abyssalbus ytuae TaxID=2926907 RepID=A0A9E6ZYM9_9FLAO|nr:glycogen synthase [Abyssalbus ytuae]UOB19381.1 glycogen synthase [Abyssalbus ytuae]